jgi:hypothetical protein
MARSSYLRAEKVKNSGKNIHLIICLHSFTRKFRKVFNNARRVDSEEFQTLFPYLDEAVMEYQPEKLARDRGIQ